MGGGKGQQLQPIAKRLQPVVWRCRARQGILAAMKNTRISLLLAVIVLLACAVVLQSATPPRGSGPEYTSDDQLKLPENYRQWVYLTTGFDMSYSANAMAMDHHMFDNVFVNPEAYKAFTETGTWPDKTMLVLEVRKAEGRGSINQRGNFQGGEVMGLEVHVKDEARLPGKWGFFGFDNTKTAKMTPKEAACYTCHQDHGAVDTTFVQFYPTLLEIAKSKGTFSAGYQKDEAAKK
ncbi:MAG TPA: cytochrome P460 family protein [Candidatus Sulfotelmatobacter sp.]|nr:cytochrome P460 family protein [Candidatus Sulfotelmatobacter sp.]